jgi:uncharacterized lipoprotein YbaY
MNAFTSFGLAADATDQRRYPRFPVALPATVTTISGQASALIHDFAVGGAMIETRMALAPGAKLSLRCGTVDIAAKVSWRKNGRIGLSFLLPLTDRDVAEQMDRSHAIAARRSNQKALAAVKRLMV